MGKLGPRKYRYILTALSWLYMLNVILGVFYIVWEIDSEDFAYTVLTFTLVSFFITCFGLFALKNESGTIMKVYAKLLIFLVILLVIGMIVLIFVMFKRQTILKELLTELMNSYYTSDESHKLMDSIQKQLECCGRKSDDDWVELPPASCCKDCTNPYYSRIYHEKGCVEVLSTIGAFVLLGVGLLIILHTVLHVFAVKAANELANKYEEVQSQPSLRTELVKI
ncbi:Tetraspanin-7 [Pseudolycoriella hygida]|uniref:Tetraspanin-7 n=1 Tax=Pseudolycoriella hygida TaxID=35572 RepID=A0A9Q0RTT8_9DIPT|nr:Tetraspanin-7 [Pseudolycoriella hygida]